MSGETAKEGFRRLAFGSVKDAVKLICYDKITEETLKGKNLFCVSEVQKSKDGGLIIRFYDRMEALRALSELESAENGAEGFMKALENGAAALREKEAE
ncbi:MAG: hypothetical protein J6I98_00385 [Clostridia bacterium]|nr:hypothetical protein [Clostridia bacterium]